MTVPIIDALLLALLTVTAVAIARSRNLLATAMLTGIFSLIGACWMLFLDAPDVAFTEAAVGAGISTVLIIATLCVLPADEKPGHESPLALVVVVLTGGVLAYGTLDMPRYGDPEAPANKSIITAAYLHSANHPPEAEGGGTHELDRYAVGIPNTVTTVLGSFRGFDTMGETAVIFTAGLGVVMILGGARRRRYTSEEEPDTSGSNEAPGRMKNQTILRVVSKLLIPYILLYAFYVQWHGDYGPGGGFQAGVIFAAAIILYTLIFGLQAAESAIRPAVAHACVALGLLLYIGVGIVTLLLGGEFLAYDALGSHGQHHGILIIETGVFITVASVMITIFYSFAELVRMDD